MTCVSRNSFNLSPEERHELPNKTDKALGARTRTIFAPSWRRNQRSSMYRLPDELLAKAFWYVVYSSPRGSLSCIPLSQACQSVHMTSNYELVVLPRTQPLPRLHGHTVSINITSMLDHLQTEIAVQMFLSERFSTCLQHA